MKITTLSLGLIVLGMSACAGFDDLDTLSVDRERCAAQGFAEGSSAMARCMDTASNARIERERREMEEFEQMEAREAERRRSRQHQGASHSAHHNNHNRRTTNTSQNAEGTFRGATGADPGLANLVMCSDGKLYEDCRNSPQGF